MQRPASDNASRPTPSLKLKLVAAALIAAIAAIGYWQFGHLLSLDALAEKEASLREYQKANPWLIYGICFVVYVVVTGLSLPGAAVLSLTFAWLVGFLPALILVSFASTSGATIAFLLSRFLFYDVVQHRFGERLEKFNVALQREGAFYLFTLRLIPAVPFFIINLVMGLTPIRIRTFWWVSQLGMLPGTAVYVWAGSSIPTLGEIAERGVKGILSIEIGVAFLALGLLPLGLKYLVGAIRSRSIADDSSTIAENDHASRS